MTISFVRHQFPLRSSDTWFWLYVRFTLSYRDVEDLLAERGLDVYYETVRRWVLKFGPLFARELRRRRARPTARWHLDEMAVTIACRKFWLWRGVDHEGEVLDLLVQRRRDKAAAENLMRKLLRKGVNIQSRNTPKGQFDLSIATDKVITPISFRASHLRLRDVCGRRTPHLSTTVESCFGR
jgi:transposase-like protein